MSLRNWHDQIDREMHPEFYGYGSRSQWCIDYEAVMDRLGATTKEERKAAHPQAYAEADRLQAERKAERDRQAEAATGCNGFPLDEAA